MKSLLTKSLTFLLLFSVASAQTPQDPPPDTGPQEVVRISSTLVQTDVVVTDKNDKIITDLTVNDFKVFENGKRQEVKFLEFVSAESGPRNDPTLSVAGQTVEPDVVRNLTTRDLRRVFAFVVDDLTIPFEDVIHVRKMLTHFVDNQMRQGDLVAIVRVVGGSGLLQQFTSDKRILRRAIAKITPRLHTYSAFNNLQSPAAIRADLVNAAASEDAGFPEEAVDTTNTNLDASDEGVARGLRALSTLATASDVINSMRALPGRKNLILVSGGLPLYEQQQNQYIISGVPTTIPEGRSYLGNVSYMLRQLTDRASRAGVVINTLDIRGLKAHRGVSSFTDPGNEATSGLFGGRSGGPAFGRQPNMGQLDNLAFDTMSAQVGLQVLADTTGGVAVTNTDNFAAGLERVMSRSSYYLIAYRPSEAFDGKYHKLEVKVERPGARVYTRQGYYATADVKPKALTKEQTIIKAAMSPLAERGIDVVGNLQYRFTPQKSATVDINLVIDAKDLEFKQASSGKQAATFDVVGFVVNNVGKTQDGFSQTVTANFSPEEHQRALANGITFTGSAELPPGNYQLRAVVNEPGTGRMGTVSTYLEVPDLTKKRLAASSVFLFAVDPAGKGSPEALTAHRQFPRKLDLRYAAIIYNPKLQGGQPQLRTRVIISRDNKILFEEPEKPLSGPVQDGQMAKVGQLSLAKAQPGRYILTLLVTDPLADKKERTIVRSIDFTLVD